jgi:hypothetical protein
MIAPHSCMVGIAMILPSGYCRKPGSGLAQSSAGAIEMPKTCASFTEFHEHRLRDTQRLRHMTTAQVGTK